MGDYSFFIKSATFLLLINAAIVSFPDQIQALTGGSINTSTVQGTNFTLQDPSKIGEASQDERVDLDEPLSFNGVVFNSDGDLVKKDSVSQGFATYNLTGFTKNSEGFYEVNIGAEFPPALNLGQRLLFEYTDGTGSKVNTSLRSTSLFTDIEGSEISFYFNSDAAIVKSIEDSTEIQHETETGAFENVVDSTGITRFTQPINNLISLYTAPSTGNRVLGAIFSLYLLGFLVFFLKEVVPG